MLKQILLASIFVITAITNVTHAEDDMKTVASKAYVDTKIETKQLKIPAAGQPNVGAGETVMTYTATGNGQIGERGLYSDISSYNATTDADKLITASALNATFTNLPTTPTTKLECANLNDGCTLWTIVDQTAYYHPRSKNLFNKNTITLNKTITIDGLESLSTNNACSDFIPVAYGKTYYIGARGLVGVAQYNSSKDFISRIGISSGGGTYTPESGISYIRVNLTQSSADTLQIEEGTTATPYEPYY